MRKIILIIFIINFGLIACYTQSNSPAEINGVNTISLHSDVLNEERTVYVYVPKEAKENNLPTLYLLDGNRKAQVTNAISYCKDNPHIIIGIPNNGNRDRDMIPVKLSSRPGSGEAEFFLKFITTELQTFIDSNYNTNGINILYGASNSGLFTVYAMLTEPEKFDAFVSSSTMIGHCDEFMNTLLNNFNPISRLENKKLFIHFGTKDPYEQVTVNLPPFIDKIETRFRDILIFKSVAVIGGKHVPKGGLNEGLQFIYNK